MSGIGEALALGILTSLLYDAMKSIRTLARELKNNDDELSALALQLEQKFPTFEDVEVLFRQEKFKDKILERDRVVLDRSLCHVLWLLEQIDEVGLLPRVVSEGSEEAGRLEVDGTGEKDKETEKQKAVEKQAGTLSSQHRDTVGSKIKFWKREKALDVNPGIAPSRASQSSDRVQKQPLAGASKQPSQLSKAWRAVSGVWNKPRLIKLVNEVRQWIDDLEKYAINVFPPILNEAPMNEVTTLKALLIGSIGLPPLRSALSIMLALSQPDYDAAKLLEVNAAAITPLSSDADAERHFVLYKGQEHLVVYKSGPVKDDRRANIGILTSEVQGLALALKNASTMSDLHVLKSPAYYWDPTASRYGILFRPPHNADTPTSAESLQEFLAKETGAKKALSINLEHRVLLARALTKSMYRLHSLGWVHKSFRPQNILLFKERDASGTRGPNDQDDSTAYIRWSSPYVLGFELSRADKGFSGYVIPEEERGWNARRYLHPGRLQTTTPPFTRIHDIYSLGVMLLEIGCMQTFAVPEKEQQLGNLEPVMLKQSFVKMARELVQTMGRTYSEVVTRCLTSEFVEEELQESDKEYDRKLLGSFEENVCEKLDGIRL